jgi:hypothetical protein
MKKKKFIINVTESCIRLGAPKSPSCCPVARAIKCHEQLRKIFGSVLTTKLRFEIGNEHVFVPLPRTAQKFIERTDLRQPTKPIRFTITLP